MVIGCVQPSGNAVRHRPTQFDQIPGKWRWRTARFWRTKDRHSWPTDRYCKVKSGLKCGASHAVPGLVDGWFGPDPFRLPFLSPEETSGKFENDSERLRLHFNPLLCFTEIASFADPHKWPPLISSGERTHQLLPIDSVLSTRLLFMQKWSLGRAAKFN